MGKPKIGASTLAFLSDPFEKLLAELSRFPTKHIELIDDGLHELNSERVRLLKTVAKTNGLTYYVHAPFVEANIAPISNDFLKTAMERLKRSLFYASQLEAKVWVFHPGVAPSIGDPTATNFYYGLAWKRNVESVRHILKLAEDMSVNAAMENCCYRRLVKTVEETKQFLEEVGTEVKLVFDAAHANLYGDPNLYFNRFKRQIVHMHACDNHGTVDEHGDIGNGNINWEALAKSVEDSGFDGAIICESLGNLQKNVEALKTIFDFRPKRMKLGSR